MSKLCGMTRLADVASNNTLNDYLEGVLEGIEAFAECKVACFNIVMEDESGHAVISYAKERS